MDQARDRRVVVADSHGGAGYATKNYQPLEQFDRLLRTRGGWSTFAFAPLGPSVGRRQRMIRCRDGLDRRRDQPADRSRRGAIDSWPKKGVRPGGGPRAASCIVLKVGFTNRTGSICISAGVVLLHNLRQVAAGDRWL